MYYIIDNTDNSIHREPSKPSYAGTQYKTAGAAKAGITRTVKHYQKAYDQVAECVANGDPEYFAHMHNQYRDATEAHFGRVHKQFASSYSVVAVDEYVEPMITRTGNCPGTGKEITITLKQSDVGGCTDPLTETYWSM
jgi:hypothetical protein|tara:strand:- start:1845 stop:2258 length:414 start_codon:yes stop_codon:yes gene_type:complete